MNKKTIWIIVAVVVVILLAWLLLGSKKSDNTALVPVNHATNTESASNTATNTPPANTATGTTTAKLSYTDALKKYGTNRIQLDSACQARPTSAVFKAGTQVMFDNRANVSRKVVFNGKTYNIAAYDYVVVGMTNSTYPAISYIDCGSSQNVAKITIEK